MGEEEKAKGVFYYTFYAAFTHTHFCKFKMFVHSNATIAVDCTSEKIWYFYRMTAKQSGVWYFFGGGVNPAVWGGQKPLAQLKNHSLLLVQDIS